MQTISSGGPTGGSIEVELGGFNGDNLVGDVYDSSGTLVPQADITIQDTTDDYTGSTTNSGKFDIDCNGAVGDTFNVTARWTVGGVDHVIRGRITITAQDVVMARDEKGRI